MTQEISSRERVLRLFRKEKIDRIPVFSGMGNITVYGLEKNGWQFNEIHLDALKMAAMAASTYEIFGFESVVVPFDLGVEAEALVERFQCDCQPDSCAVRVGSHEALPAPPPALCLKQSGMAGVHSG